MKRYAVRRRRACGDHGRKRRVWHDHGKECAQNVDEQAEIEHLVPLEYETEGNNEHRRVAEVKGPCPGLEDGIKGIMLLFCLNTN